MPSPFSAANSKSIREMFAGVAPRYDLANQVLSLGLDRSWRKFVCQRVAAWKPARILDLATGSGVLAEELARTNTGSFVVGADFCIPMLKVASKRNVEHLIVADGLALPLDWVQFVYERLLRHPLNSKFLWNLHIEFCSSTRHKLIHNPVGRTLLSGFR
jgi:ubiquinone/menaquinone biosynthesis C-methylase UbiE